MEILPAYSEENQDRIRRQREIVALVRQANYRLLVVDKKSGELQPIVDIPVNPPIERCDYLFCPSEKFEAVQKL